MNITRVERVESTSPVELPEPWLPAWREPDGEPVQTHKWAVYRIHTDAGITGVGPAMGPPPTVDIGDFDPTRVGQFWTRHLSGHLDETVNPVAGLDIALWDTLGKAVGRPVHELLGGHRAAVPAYAATSRLLDSTALLEQVRTVAADGFDTVKVRLHRTDPADDVAVLRAVHEALDGEVTLLADANQNNDSPGYDRWSRRTAERVVAALDGLGLGFIEEPLPRRDVAGLASIADQTTTPIAGGEHSRVVREFEPHLRRRAYDILQPDVAMDGTMGITGLRRVATLASCFDRPVIPHVTGNGNLPLCLAATLQVAGACDNIPLVEFPHDPPMLTPATLQTVVTEPITVSDGTVAIPDGAGLGVIIDEDELHDNGTIVWEAQP